jgi:hypothetical protein
MEVVLMLRAPCSAGAAGNFLASINQLSINAFKAVMDIDILGSYNTLKATLPYLVESAAKNKSDGKTRESLGSLYSQSIVRHKSVLTVLRSSIANWLWWSDNLRQCHNPLHRPASPDPRFCSQGRDRLAVEQCRN